MDLAKRRQGPRRFGVGPLFLALAAQALVLLLALFVVVVRPVLRSEPDFQAKKTIYLPQRELEHRMAVSAFQQAVQPPSMRRKLTTSSLLPSSIPSLPDLPAMDFNPVETSLPFAPADALLGQSGLLGGMGGTVTELSSFSFFGLKEAATKIVICVDISASVKNKVERAGYTMNQVKEATQGVIERLNANTLFGFIQFSRDYEVFRPYLVTATKANREAALTWLDAEFRTDGSSGSNWRRDEPNGIQSVIRAAFALDPAPDLLILLSDGSFQRTRPSGGGETVPWEELSREIAHYQAILPDPARIQFIGFSMREADRSAMRAIVRRWNGSLREIGDER